MPRQLPPEFRQRALRMLQEAIPEHETEYGWHVKSGIRGGAKPAERPAAGGGAARQVDEALPCNCLAAGTQVATAGGDKAVEQVRVGDRVWTRSLDGSGSQLRTVTGLFTKRAEELLTVTVAGEQVKVTEPS